MKKNEKIRRRKETEVGEKGGKRREKKIRSGERTT